MMPLHGQHASGAPGSVRDWNGEPAIAATKRIFGRRKQNPRAHLSARLRLSDAQRSTLAEIGKRLGRQALQQVARVAKPDTILAWYRKLIAQKFDGSKHRRYPGRPSVNREIINLVLRMARENTGWGYDRIAGALDNLGYCISDQTVGNILRRFDIEPAPRRRQQMNWAEFIRSHMAVLAGIDSLLSKF